MIMITDIIGCRVIGPNRPRSVSYGRLVIGVMSAGCMPGMPAIGDRTLASMVGSIMDAGITDRDLRAVIGLAVISGTIRRWSMSTLRSSTTPISTARS